MSKRKRNNFCSKLTNWSTQSETLSTIRSPSQITRMIMRLCAPGARFLTLKSLKSEEGSTIIRCCKPLGATIPKEVKKWRVTGDISWREWVCCSTMHLSTTESPFWTKEDTIWSSRPSSCAKKSWQKHANCQISMTSSIRSAETPKRKTSTWLPPQNSPSLPCTAESGSRKLLYPSNTAAVHRASESKPVLMEKTLGVFSVCISSKKLNSSASPDHKTHGRCWKTWLSTQKSFINLWVFPIVSSQLSQVLSTMQPPRSTILRHGSPAMRHTAS